MMKKPFCLTAALAMAIAAPAVAQDSTGDIRIIETQGALPSIDQLIQSDGAFGARWGATSEEAHAAIGYSNGVNDLGSRNASLFGQRNLHSYNWLHKGIWYELDAFFDPNANAFTMVSVASTSNKACAQFETSLVEKLGEGDPDVQRLEDVDGPYESRARLWYADGKTSIYAFANIDSPGEDKDFCMFTAMADGAIID